MIDNIPPGYRDPADGLSSFEQIVVSEKTECKFVKREGESCTLNNNCKYPYCNISKSKQHE